MRKKQLFYITVLSVMLSMTLIGSVLVSQVAARVRAASVTFSPDCYNWGDPPPDPWQVRISVGWWYTWFIDKNSIRLEDTVAPAYTKLYWFRFYAYFDGNDVKDVIGLKLGHEGLVPGCHYVDLTITGRLTWGSDTFEGSDTIRVLVPDFKPP